MANFRFRVKPTFPTNVSATAGLVLTKENGNWVFSPDWGSLPDDYPFVRWDAAQIIEPSDQEQALINLGLPLQRNNLIIKIPTDYATLQEAVDATAHWPVEQGVRIILEIEDGHALTHGLFVRDGDYSRYWITYEGDSGTPGSATVSLASGFVGFSDAGLTGDTATTDTLIQGYNAAMPVLACKIDMGNAYGDGYYGVQNCSGLVVMDCGVINAGYNGLEMRSSRCSAHRTVWDGANNSGIRVSHASSVAAQGATALNCCQSPSANGAAVDVSRASTVHMFGGKASGVNQAGVNVRRVSTFCGDDGGEWSSATADGVVAFHNSRASVWGCTIVNCGTYGVRSESGSVIDCFGSTITGSGTLDLFVQRGGTIVATNVTTTAGTTNPLVLSNSNFAQWAIPNGNGIGYFGATTGPLNNIGTFSDSGATAGKTFSASGVLDSSRSSLSAVNHHRFYNTNGQVGGIQTIAGRTHFQTTADTAVFYTSGADSPEGVVTAGVGAVYSRTNGGNGTTLYIKESGTGNTGWVAVAFLSSSTADQAITGGFIITPLNLGTVSSGTTTPDPGDRPQQYYTNGGAHTLAPSSNKGSYTLDILNNASAGDITTSGWTRVTGDPFTTANTHAFRCWADIGQQGSTLHIEQIA